MTYKRIRKPFLIAISFLTVWLTFACKGQNDSNNPSVAEEFAIAFRVMPSEGGNIKATVDGKPITSGALLKKDSEVVFNLETEGDYTIDEWLGAGVTPDKDNPLTAKLKVSRKVTAIAKLKRSTDPKLVLDSLSMYKKGVGITNLNDVKVEVENFVKTLDSSDVVAKFTYGTQTMPKEITVKVDKHTLNEGENSVKLSVPPLEGSYGPWAQMVKITRKATPEQEDIHEKVQLNAIEVALLTTKLHAGQYKYDEYAPVEKFNPEVAGPYMAKEDAKTAYVAIRVKKEKPESGDYEVKLTNTTSYIKTASFSRSATDPAYLVLKKIALSKGHNILEIEVKSPDGAKTGKYVVVVKYDGGPDPVKLEMSKRKMLPGVYCPAQRKPLEGETPDYMWVICFAGWCPACPRVLNLAGIKGDKVASKYRSKGLRVVAIDTDGTQKSESMSKWKASGADYYLYDTDMNCLITIYKGLTDGYYPFSFTIKDGKGKALSRGSEVSGVETTFGF